MCVPDPPKSSEHVCLCVRVSQQLLAGVSSACAMRSQAGEGQGEQPEGGDRRKPGERGEVPAMMT